MGPGGERSRSQLIPLVARSLLRSSSLTESLEQATAKGNLDAQSVRRKSIYPKEIISTDCRAVFSTTVCWVCLPSDGVAREAALLVPSVGRIALRCTIALTADDLCAQTVSAHMKY